MKKGNLALAAFSVVVGAIIIAIASATILFNLTNAGGEAGHLGGIIMGALIMTIWKFRIMNRYR